MSTTNDPTAQPAPTSEPTTTGDNTGKKLNIFDIRKLVDTKVETPETTEQIYNTVVQRRADVIIADRVALFDSVEQKIVSLNNDLKKIKPDIGEVYGEKGQKIKENDGFSKKLADERAAIYAKIKKLEDQLSPILAGNGTKENWAKLAEANK